MTHSSRGVLAAGVVLSLSSGPKKRLEKPHLNVLLGATDADALLIPVCTRRNKADRFVAVLPGDLVPSSLIDRQSVFSLREVKLVAVRSLDSMLSLPDEAPGKLLVAGNASVDCLTRLKAKLASEGLPKLMANVLGQL